MSLRNLINKWFPPETNPALWLDQLRRYYSENKAYHDMTASGDKTTHPQMGLLQSLVKKGGNYLEVGCGSGVVCRFLSADLAITGVDYSTIAIDHALCGAPPNCRFIQADAANMPFEHSVFDGIYSFEMLEHIVDPEKAIDEMIRVLKPGGFLLLSIPNRFSLDLHIKKSLLPRVADVALAAARLVYDKFSDRLYFSLKPDLVDPPYPDCDMITAVFPDKLESYLQRQGCEVKFLDAYYMRAHAEGSTTDLYFQRNTNHWFYKYFGDHILLLAIKGA